MPGATLLQAIKTLYGTMSGMPVLWLDEVPEDHAATLPQCVLIHGGEVPQPDSYDEANGNPAVVFGEWDFFLFAENDSDAVETLATNLKSTFTPAALVLDFDPNARYWRTLYKVSRSPDRSTTGKPIYQAQVSYRIEFGENA